MSRAKSRPGVGGLCKAVFYIDSKTHLENRRHLDDLSEHGGVFEIDWKTNTAGKGSRNSKGGYDFIDIDRGLIDWHSHPSKCKSEKVCALGLPSPDDMKNIFVGILAGSLGHLVYGKEGTYVIQLKPTVLLELEKKATTAAQKSAEGRRTRDAFFQEYNQYMTGPVISYDEYRRRWLRCCDRQGFKVTFFKGDQVPYLRSAYRCELRTLPPSAQFVTIPRS